MFDLRIDNASIIDGTGQPPYRGDLAIMNGTIAAVGPKVEGPARRVRDAAGLAALPGFVDIHRHGDLVPWHNPPSRLEISQGITTFVSGLCGFSAAPNSREHYQEFQEYAEPILGPTPPLPEGMDFAAFLEAAGKQPLACNQGFLVGGGALRIAVCGFKPEPLDKRELAAVTELARDSLAAGALGLSVGLTYIPEIFHTRDELLALFRVAAEFSRPVVTHVRGEGSLILPAVEEVISCARAAGAPLHISHLKAAGRKNWRLLAPKALAMIQEAQAAGQDVTYDLYPYAAGSTAMHALLPPAYQAGGVAALLERLADPAIRREILAELRRDQGEWDNLIPSTGWDSVVVAGGRDPSLAGRNVLEIARERGQEPEECAMLLILENAGNLPMVSHNQCLDDVEMLMTTPGAIIASDSLYSQGGRPHPRKYGAQARFISHYALQSKRLSIEAAVRAVTHLPARRLGLTGRGSLQPGQAADVVLLDLSRYRDTATYEEPERLPEGIDSVLVNGHWAIEAGIPLDAVAGEVLRV